VCHEIVLELPRAHYNCMANVFYFRVKPLGPREDLRHKLHWELLLHYFVFVLDFLLNIQGSATTECVAETYKMRGCPYYGLGSVGKCLR
jgi:hypothetical protein